MFKKLMLRVTLLSMGVNGLNDILEFKLHQAKIDLDHPDFFGTSKMIRDSARRQD
jgi:hypothetical protein